MATKRWASGSAAMEASRASTRARTMSSCAGALDTDDARARVARERRSLAPEIDRGRGAATRARAVDIARVEECAK